MDKRIEFYNMAKSPAHKWGQNIGDLLEIVFEKEAIFFVQKHNLYLDRKGLRKARRGKKVSWIDNFNNSHDLDFVIERDGSNEKIGTPVAFIEVAWRRYTKHSRNKAQEIQGAVLPLVATHKNYAPFIGAVLAGEFTKGALTQLKSLGFNILYFSYNTVIDAFAAFGLDARTEENTTLAEIQDKNEAWENFTEKTALIDYLIETNREQINSFFDNLGKCVRRFIEGISVIPLHGKINNLDTVDEAILFIENYGSDDAIIDVLKYEIAIRYNNGDKVDGIFNTREEAIEFLRSYAPPKPKTS